MRHKWTHTCIEQDPWVVQSRLVSITRILKDGAPFGKVRTLRVEGEVEIGEVTNPEDEVGDTGISKADTRDACHLDFGLEFMVELLSSLDDTRPCTQHRKLCRTRLPIPPL